MKNILLYRNSDLRYRSIRPGPLRDVSRSSRHVGHRMRWTLWRQVWRRDPGKVETGFPIRITPNQNAPDENAAADGEVVWSWRRDPGATLAGVFPRATGARKAASPGRARISRKTIAWGKPGCLGCTCQNRVHSFASFRTRRCGRSQRPAFPAPSFREGNEMAEPGRNVPRERERMLPRHCDMWQ